MSTAVSRLVGWVAGLLTLALVAGLAVGLSTCHKLPLWTGSVEVTPIEKSALDACGRGELTVAAGDRLHRAPYLQNVTERSATVVFAAWPDPAYRVDVTTTSGELVSSAPARAAGEPERARELLERRESLAPQETVRPTDFYLQRSDLAGLEAGTLYCYQLFGPGGAMIERAPLQTAPAAGAGDTVELVVLGDTGTGSAAQKAIANRLDEVAFELMLFLGDVAYTRGTAAQLEARFFEIYDRFLRFVPAYPVLGNHDYQTRGARPYFESFVLPDNERTYSFDWGDVHFVALDTNRIDRAQADWLAGDLATTDRAWTIVFGHHPPYSNSRRGPHWRFRRMLVPILEEHGVDLVLSGHEHHYERFAPRGGVHYVVSGGGGGRLTKVVGRGGAVVSAPVHHYVALAITADRLELRAVDIEGAVFDTLTLEK